jgi:hypothetical protein
MPDTLFIGANVEYMSTSRVERTLLSAAFALVLDFGLICGAITWTHLIESSAQRTSTESQKTDARGRTTQARARRTGVSAHRGFRGYTE